MTAITLVQAMKLATTPLDRIVRKKYAEATDLLRVLPFETIQGSAKRFNREKTMPTVAFRAVGGSYTPNNGDVDPQYEGLFIAGGELDVDTFIVATGAPGTREQKEAEKIKVLAHSISHALVKGDSFSTANTFDGMQVRATGARLLANGSTSGGDVLSLAKVDEAIDLCPGANALIMSKATRRAFTRGIRGGLDSPVTYGRDEFGKQVTMYADLPILIADGVDHLNQSLAFDEANPGGGSAVGTSIYVARIGSDGLHGIQHAPPTAKDLGELQSSPVFRTRVEWFVGLAQETEDCLVRLYGIKAGAAAA